MKQIILLITSLFLFISGNLLAQSGANDPSFNSTDSGFGNGDAFSSYVYTYATQADGKILAGGSFSQYNGYPCENVVRLFPNGKIDSSFQAPVISGYVERITIQNDGKILVGGLLLTSINGVNMSGILRLNQDGTIDTTFTGNLGAVGGSVKSIGVQSDGKIVIAGDFSEYNGIIQTKLARLNPDGSLDTSFISAIPLYTASMWTMSVLADDKILLGGTFSTYDGNPVGNLMRLNADGSLDFSFNPSGSGPNSRVGSIVVQADSKIIIGGLFTVYNGTAVDRRVARLNADGTLDPTFNAYIDMFVSGGITALDVQDDGKVLLAEKFTGIYAIDTARVVRLNVDGSLDNSFNIGSRLTKLNSNGVPIQVYTLNVQNDGSICVGGNFITYSNRPARYGTKLNPNGLIDTSFNVGTGANESVRTIELQSDGKILVGGSFTACNGAYTTRIARLHTDGSLDYGFSTGLGANSEIRAIAYQTDGKIVAGGTFTEFNSSQKNRLVRLNNDGSLDNTFNIGSGANNAVGALAVQSDGKLVVGGNFTTFNGVAKNKIVRLNTDGSIDNTFITGTGLNDEVYDIEIQSDGKIVVVGDFTYYNGSLNVRVIRLNPDGSADLSFNNQNGANYIVQSVAIQNDGKILIGGGFGTYNNISVGNIARLNQDGTLDNTFNSGSGVNSYINAVEVMSDGKVLIGGSFTSYNGNPCNYFTRLNANGTFDTTFNSGSEANNNVHTLALQQDEKVLMGGLFTGYNGVGRNRIARVLNCPSIDFQQSIITSTSCFGGNDGSIDITPVGGGLPYASFSWSNGSITEDLSGLPAGTYSVQIIDANGCASIQSFNLTEPVIITSNNSETACNSYTWPVNNQTYTVSGQYIDTIPSAAGCDSIVTLNLTIIPSLPLIVENAFSMPTDANNCFGEVAVSVSGNTDFELDFDNGSQLITSNGYSLVTNLCAGIHDLHVTDNCGDTLSTTIVIPVDSNYVFTNPFIDSLAQDSLGVTLTNCDIYYNGIDTAYIDSIWATGNTVSVIWNIVDSNGSNLDTTNYVLNNGNGVYWLQLSVFCPNKSVGEYFTVTEAIYFNNGTVSTAGLTDLESHLFELYPNPTNDQVHINFSGSDAELTVYDVQGKVVLKDRIQNQEIISLQNFERGVYLFDFQNSKGHNVQRVVKQ